VLNSNENFIRLFAVRDSLFRVVSLLAGTFTITAISLLPGFGVKGLVIASSIQLLLSAALEIPTSVVADKYGRSKILKISLILKVFVSIALVFAIYFASIGETQWVWYAFFLEAFLDAISNTLISGSYQVAYLTLYGSIESDSKAEKPPLFLRSFQYGIKFRILLPILFTLILISVFELVSSFNQNLYVGAYFILALIVVSRIVLYKLISSDFNHFPEKSDKATVGVKEGVKQVFTSIKNQKAIFLTYSVTCLLSFLGTLYLTGQSMKYLPLMNLKPSTIWIGAIVTCVGVYLLRTISNILILPKLTREKLHIGLPLLGFLIIISGILLSGTDIVFESVYTKFSVLILITVFVFVAFDTIAKFIESVLKEILSSDYKATWISLGNTFAYFVFGLISFVMIKVPSNIGNLYVGILLSICGFVILTSQLLHRTKESEITFLESLQFQLIKLLLFIICLIVSLDSLSYSHMVKSKIAETRTKTTETVLVGIKSSIIQGNIVEASNFLYSLKSGNFIKCFELDIQKTHINDCSINSIDFKNSDSENVKIEYDGNNYGQIIVYFDFLPFRKDLILRILADIFFSLIFYLFLFYVVKKMARVIAKEVEFLHSSIEKSQSTNSGKFHIREFREIYLRVNESIRLREQLQLQTALIDIASQVSHDIRSPLAALNLMLNQIGSVPEEKRVIIRSAVNRINDIANQLLQKSKDSMAIVKIDSMENPHAISESKNKNIKAILISPLVESLVSEKRIQFREHQGIEIEVDITEGYGLFVKFCSIELKRCLSNLINNSVEALSNRTGKVLISVSCSGKQVLIKVEDNGIGIPNEFLDKVGEVGFSVGKTGFGSGNGLGLSHAKKTVESAGGNFRIESTMGSGTAISISFEKAAAPSWFVEEVKIRKNMFIASLDDDISIHQIWKNRFQRLGNATKFITHKPFTSGQEFIRWVEVSRKEDLSLFQVQPLFLIDYELLGQKNTGLELIEKLQIAKNSILVTSRYEEDHIRDVCEQLGIKLIPKSMAGLVPIIEETNREVFDGILIDDDRLVHACWRSEANSRNKKYLGFSHPEEFLFESNRIHFDSKIFVDSNLGNGIKGEEFSKVIYNIGFKNIFLCTGYPEDSLPDMFWVKKTVGKSPCFDI
jgi:signal transduction histidine kinase